MPGSKAKQVSATIRQKAKDLAKGAAGIILPGKDERNIQRRAVRSLADQYYKQYKKVWMWVFISLPLDFLLLISAVHLSGRGVDSATMETVLVVSLCLALLSLFRQEVFVGSVLFRFFRDRFLLRSRRLALWILVLLVICATFADVYFRHQGGGTFAIIVPLLAAMAAVVPALGTIKERLHRLQRKARNRLIWIEEFDRQRYLFLLLPLVPARLISLVAAFSSPGLFSFVICWTTSLLLLLFLEPRESDFFVLCRKCLRKTSRSLAGMRYCPQCARVAFHIPELAAEEKNS